MQSLPSRPGSQYISCSLSRTWCWATIYVKVSVPVFIGFAGPRFNLDAVTNIPFSTTLAITTASDYGEPNNKYMLGLAHKVSGKSVPSSSVSRIRTSILLSPSLFTTSLMMRKIEHLSSWRATTRRTIWLLSWSSLLASSITRLVPSWITPSAQPSQPALISRLVPARDAMWLPSDIGQIGGSTSSTARTLLGSPRMMVSQIQGTRQSHLGDKTRTNWNISRYRHSSSEVGGLFVPSLDGLCGGLWNIGGNRMVDFFMRGFSDKWYLLLLLLIHALATSVYDCVNQKSYLWWRSSRIDPFFPNCVGGILMKKANTTKF